MSHTDRQKPMRTFACVRRRNSEEAPGRLGGCEGRECACLYSKDIRTKDRVL